MEALSETVTLSTGEATTLRELLKSGPIALVFVRHLGCTFCREHVRQLAGLPAKQVIFVSTADPETTRRFQKWIGSQNRFICDESGDLFPKFGLSRATLAQAISPKVLARGLVSLMRGNINGLPAGDPLRLGGTFVFDSEGKVVWSHVSKDVSDNSSVVSVRTALANASE